MTDLEPRCLAVLFVPNEAVSEVFAVWKIVNPPRAQNMVLHEGAEIVEKIRLRDDVVDRAALLGRQMLGDRIGWKSIPVWILRELGVRIYAVPSPAWAGVTIHDCDFCLALA